MTNKILVDCRIDSASSQRLVSRGFELIFNTKCSCLQEPVSAHPDMSCVKIDEYLFVASDIAHLFVGFENLIICEREGAVLNYPKDVMFNCAVVGKNILCKKSAIHPKILEYALKKRYNIINVNQGYTKCSVCIVSDNAIITEDENIYKVATLNNIETLLVEKGKVGLAGYDYGFIGGASGLIENNLLAFYGNIELHPQSKEIYIFCKEHKVDIFSLNDFPLYDIGSIIRL